MNRGDESKGGRAQGGDDTWPALEPVGDPEAEADLISASQILRYVDAPGTREVDPLAPESDDLEDTAPVPRITRMPEGIRVDERRVGRAVAQWILHVRCECGRRWFETEIVDTASCPRCGVLVYIDIDARGARR